MKWKIYYSDHAEESDTSVNSEQVTPYNIIRRADVQVIVQESPDLGWVTLSGYDYYMWDCRGEETKWWGGDIFGLHHYLLQSGYKCVLFGTMIDKKSFSKIFNLALEEFEDKTGYTREERKP